MALFASCPLSPIALTFSLLPVLYQFLNPMGEGFDGQIWFRVKYSKSINLGVLSGCGYLSCNSLLQEEVSLIMAEQDTDLWVSQKVIRSHFSAMLFWQNNGIWFSPRSLSRVLGHLNNVRNGSHAFFYKSCLKELLIETWLQFQTACHCHHGRKQAGVALGE